MLQYRTVPEAYGPLFSTSDGIAIMTVHKTDTRRRQRVDYPITESYISVGGVPIKKIRLSIFRKNVTMEKGGGGPSDTKKKYFMKTF